MIDISNITIYENPPKPKIFFILGGPGAGKGTLCDAMVKELGFHHFSTGDLLRKELEENPDSEFSRTLKSYMSEGKLVSSEFLLDLLFKKIKKLKDPNLKILLDGFPRNLENVETWNKKKLDIIFDFKLAIFLDCCFETMKSNILERGKTSGRNDDNIETIKKRIATFESETKPLVAVFEKEQKIIKIDAEQSPEIIFNEVLEKFKVRNIL